MMDQFSRLMAQWKELPHRDSLEMSFLLLRWDKV